MIAIIDYGMGNLRSVQKAFEHVGANARVTQSPEDLRAAQKIVLPGVGAMKPAMDKLLSLHLIEPLKFELTSGKPFLGICLGFQLLFEFSDEGGRAEGLGLIKGSVKRFTSLKVPHMGWNQIFFHQKKCPLFNNVAEGASFYFCHSYYGVPEDEKTIATKTEYGCAFASSIHRNNMFGVQFHPEKSQDNGLKLLRNFSELRS